MLLDKTTSSLIISIGTAIATGQLVCTVEYEDTIRDALMPATVQADLPAGDTIIIPNVPADTARRIIELSIYNKDSVAHDVAVELNVKIVKFSTALASLKTLHYNRYNGWSVV